jgi:hypothetical protein
VGTASVDLWALGPQKGVELAQKTIKKFRLARHSIYRVVLSYIPPANFAASVTLSAQLSATTIPVDIDDINTHSVLVAATIA